MTSVLITGGAGFIGSHLAQRLAPEGFSVRILDVLSLQIHGSTMGPPAWLRDGGIDFHRASVTDREALRRALDGIDHVVHLAAETGTGQSMYEIARYNEVNSQGTAILLDLLASESHQVSRLILSSSRSVYGEGAYRCSSCGAGPVYPGPRKADDLKAGRWEPLCPVCGGELMAVATTENAMIQPASIYAATKYAQEDLVRIACGALGIDHVIFRFQNVYGERQSLNNPYTGILSIFSTRVRRGLELPIFEDGQESRDFVHVDDVVEAMLAAIRSEASIGDVLNVGSGRATTVESVAAALSQALGEPARLRVTGDFRLGDIRHNYADLGRIQAKLGYKPGVELQQGLDRFAAWVKSEPLPDDQLDKANNELRARRLMS